MLPERTANAQGTYLIFSHSLPHSELLYGRE